MAKRDAIPGATFIPKYQALVKAGKTGKEIAAEFKLEDVKDLSAMTTRHRKAAKAAALKQLAGADMTDEAREAKAEAISLTIIPKLEQRANMYDSLVAAALSDTSSESETDKSDPAGGEDTPAG